MRISPCKECKNNKFYIDEKGIERRCDYKCQELTDWREELKEFKKVVRPVIEDYYRDKNIKYKAIRHNRGRK